GGASPLAVQRRLFEAAQLLVGNLVRRVQARAPAGGDGNERRGQRQASRRRGQDVYSGAAEELAVAFEQVGAQGPVRFVLHAHFIAAAVELFRQHQLAERLELGVGVKR